MSIKPLDLTGGKSVYCFNESQLSKAFELADGETESGERIRAAVATLEKELNRNERCAVAFRVIDNLNKSSDA